MKPSPLEVFQARVEARAYLFGAGVYEYHQAIEPLLIAAKRDGLLDRLGAAAVMEIIDKAFTPFSEPE